MLKLTFEKHIRELKTRLIYSISFFALCFALTIVYSDKIYYAISLPLIQHGAGKASFIYTDLSEAFFAKIDLSAKLAFIVTMPFIALQLYLFISPGLYKSELILVRYIIFSSVFLYILGVFFAYFIVMPKAFEFFLSFQTNSMQLGNVGGIYDNPVSISLHAKISEYIGLVSSLAFAFAIAFQLPVILLILTIFGIVSASFLATNRRFGILLIFIIAGIITPPDVLSQLLLAFPLVILYEITIFFARKVERVVKHA
ncbi:MAG: twin-arginine translocase subunit TatC [Rickettsiaceae bacterium]|nr:twin-arginine translocase subunit TatC [Rickettsiaceae bacterium]